MLKRLYRTLVKSSDESYTKFIQALLWITTKRVPKTMEMDDGWVALDVSTDITTYIQFKRIADNYCDNASEGLHTVILYDVFGTIDYD